jgi:hypothetical protein
MGRELSVLGSGKRAACSARFSSNFLRAAATARPSSTDPPSDISRQNCLATRPFGGG